MISGCRLVLLSFLQSRAKIFWFVWDLSRFEVSLENRSMSRNFTICSSQIFNRGHTLVLLLFQKPPLLAVLFQAPATIMFSYQGKELMVFDKVGIYKNRKIRSSYQENKTSFKILSFFSFQQAIQYHLLHRSPI